MAGGTDIFFEGQLFCKSLMGEAHICDKLPVRATFLAPYFVNHMKTHFLWVSGKNKTKKHFDRKFNGGGTFLAGRLEGPLIFCRVGKPKSLPPAINNEHSLII